MPFFARVASPGGEEEEEEPPLWSSAAAAAAATSTTNNNGSTFSASPWWSLEEGPVKVVGYSTEHDFGRGSEQLSFLERELLSPGAIDRRRTPWLVVVGHRPMYIDSNFSGRAAPLKADAAALSPAETPLNASDVAVSRALREQLEPLFLEAGVDATFHGHHHSWQRTCATDGTGECVADAENHDGGAGGGSGRAEPPSPEGSPRAGRRRNATVHFVIGHAGGDFTDGSLQVPTPPLFRSVEFQHGHARLRADAGEMTVEAVRASDGAVFDSVTLRKRGAVVGGGGSAAEPPSSPVVAVPPPSASSPPPQQPAAAAAAAAAAAGANAPAGANAAAVASASTKENKAARLLSQRRILLLRGGGEVAAAVAASTVLSG